MRSLLHRIVAYGRMVRFSHSVFALPFAFTSAALAAQGGRITAWQVLWIVVAMVGARSAALGFNRLADHWIDARNPRTADRELPRGVLSRVEVGLFVLGSAAALVLAAALLNPLCLALSPVALLIVFGYSYTKRFTSLSHLALGLALGMAPVGAWLAIRGSFHPLPMVLALAVLAWVAGFDMIYACQDAEFDRQEGLHSLPARLGVRASLLVARALHVVSIVLLASLFWLAPLHPLYLLGVAVIAGMLVYEHSLVSPADLSRVMQAFNLNGWVSLGYFAATLLAVILA